MLVPLQFPPAGVPTSVIVPAPKHRDESGPAEAGVGSITVTKTVSVFVQPFPFVKE